MIIDYVPSEQIYPAHGVAYPKQQKILIRNDISGQFLLLVLAHEKYHLRDTSKNVYYRELKAYIYAAWKHPRGFILDVIKAIGDPDRTIAYLKKLKKGY